MQSQRGCTFQGITSIGEKVILYCSQPLIILSVIYFFLFAPLVAKELEAYRLSINRRPIRKQKNSALPCGDSPDTIFLSRGIDCRVNLQEEAMTQVDRWMGNLGGESVLAFLDDEEMTWATVLYSQIGSPVVSLNNVWAAFGDMVDQLAV